MNRVRAYLVDMACLVPLTILGQILLLDGEVTDWEAWVFSVLLAVGRTVIPQAVELLVYLKHRYGTQAVGAGQ